MAIEERSKLVGYNHRPQSLSARFSRVLRNQAESGFVKTAQIIRRMMGRHGELSESRIRFAYHLMLGRDARRDEIDLVLGHFDSTVMLRTHLAAEANREFTPLKVNEGLSRVPINPMLPPALVHLHIPKTAGTSMNIKLLSSFLPDERLAVSGRLVRSEIINMEVEDRARLKLLVGHDSHGVHLWMPQPVHYLTCLRQPDARLLSYYKYVKRNDEHPMHTLVNETAPDFGAFLELASTNVDLRGECDNGQVRCLANAKGPVPMSEPVLQAARRNLFSDNMTFGVTERFGALLQVCKDKGYIHTADNVVANAAKDKDVTSQSIAALSSKQRQILDLFTRFDRRLYEDALHVLDFRNEGQGQVEGQVKVLAQGPNV